MNAPDRLYYKPGCYPTAVYAFEPFADSVEYIRADLYEKLKVELEVLKTHLRDCHNAG